MARRSLSFASKYTTRCGKTTSPGTANSTCYGADTATDAGARIDCNERYATIFSSPNPDAAVISNSSESDGEDLMPDDERRYRYAYAMRLANVEGQLRALVRWEPTIEPLTSLSLVDARRIERIAADRPQVLPHQEQPRYPYEDILEVIPMEGGEIRMLVDWVDTYEPLENISQEDVQRLLREHELMHN
ncbi:hypothetical protein ON010_g12641 [Phytophthora cinnamomi]|nr:hypothetical protein ON010_g12641 [Phytophthora cinnamomi]